MKETFHGYTFFGSEDEDGRLRSLPHLLAKAEAGAIGQGDIRHRQVVWPSGPQSVSLGQGAGPRQCVALLFQGKGQSADKADIIFQPEKFCHSDSLFDII